MNDVKILQKGFSQITEPFYQKCVCVEGNVVCAGVCVCGGVCLYKLVGECVRTEFTSYITESVSFFPRSPGEDTGNGEYGRIQ